MTESKEDGLRAEIETLRETISAIGGYLLNAKIDLETGTKKSARSTIEGAIRATQSAEAAVTRLVRGYEAEIDALSASSPPVGGSGEMRQHQWEPSTLGHGGLICKHCRMTQMEAAVLGMECDAAPSLAAPVPNGVPEGAKPDYWALWSPSGMHIGLWSERKLAETAAEGFSAGYRIQPLYASPVTPEGLSGGDPKWPAYVPQVIEYEEGGYAQLLLEDAAVIHAEEMTVTVLRRMSSPEREILGFQWEIPFKEHG